MSELSYVYLSAFYATCKILDINFYPAISLDSRIVRCHSTDSLFNKLNHENPHHDYVMCHQRYYTPSRKRDTDKTNKEYSPDDCTFELGESDIQLCQTAINARSEEMHQDKTSENYILQSPCAVPHFQDGYITEAQLHYDTFEFTEQSTMELSVMTSKYVGNNEQLSNAYESTQQSNHKHELNNEDESMQQSNDNMFDPTLFNMSHIFTEQGDTLRTKDRQMTKLWTDDSMQGQDHRECIQELECLSQDINSISAFKHSETLDYDTHNFHNIGNGVDHCKQSNGKLVASFGTADGYICNEW